MRAGRAGSVVLLALAAACGRGPSTPAAPDLSTPRSAFAGAMRALEAGDLAGLAPYLTADAAERLRRDLDAWREMLVHPREGPRLLALAPPPGDEREAEEVRRALAGDPAGLLRLYVATDPHPFSDVAPADVPPGTRRLEVLYAVRDGSRRSVVLAADGPVWKVDRLQL